MRNSSTGKHIGPLSTHFAAFTDRLSREGHSPPSRWCNISLFRHFNQWLDRTIHVGRVASIDCIASAADDHMCYAMLAHRDGETSEPIDEINGS